jgi:hypothetical protein
VLTESSDFLNNASHEVYYLFLFTLVEVTRIGGLDLLILTDDEAL